MKGYVQVNKVVAGLRSVLRVKATSVWATNAILTKLITAIPNSQSS